MITIKIADIAKTKRLENAYALQRALDISPTMASRLWKGTFKQIATGTIDKLCDLLDCNPSDFIVYSSDKPKAEKPVREPVKAAGTTEGMLTTHQVAQMAGLSRKRVNDYINSGQLPAERGKQGHYLIAKADAEKFADWIKNKQ